MRCFWITCGLVGALFFSPSPVWPQTTTPQQKQLMQDEKMFRKLLAEYHLLAKLLVHQQRYQESVLLLKIVYEESFRSAKVAQELCDVMDTAGRTPETIDILKEQIRLNPFDPYWTKHLIDTYEKMKKWEDALQLRLEWRQKNPSDLDNLAKLAENYRQLQKNSQANELVDKIAMATRDKLFMFQNPPSSYRNPLKNKQDADGFVALQLQRQLGLQQDFEQYAAAFLLQQNNRQFFENVLKWLKEKPPTGYIKSTFPDQQAVGLWLAGQEKEAAEILNNQFPPRLYPGADLLLFDYYNRNKMTQKIQMRFGDELPDYLNHPTNIKVAPRKN